MADGLNINENIKINELISEETILSGNRNIVVTNLSQDPENKKTIEDSRQFLKVDEDTNYVHVRISPDIFVNVRDDESEAYSRVSLHSDDKSSTDKGEHKHELNSELYNMTKQTGNIARNRKKAKPKYMSKEGTTANTKTDEVTSASSLADEELLHTKSPNGLESDLKRDVKSALSRETPVTTSKIGVHVQHRATDKVFKDDGDFLNDSYMETMLDGIGEVWCEVFVLMGIPFVTIESALSRADRGASLQTTLLCLLHDWRDKQYYREDRGVPMLLAALRKGGRWVESISVQKSLKVWRERLKNPEVNPLCRWLERAYKDLDVFIPGEYPRPLSDQFYAMLAPRMRATPELARALNLSITELEVVRQNDKYANETMACIKALTISQSKGGSDVMVLDTILTALEEVGYLDARNTAIMSLKGWMKRTTDDDDVMLVPVRQMLKKHLASDHRVSAGARLEFTSHRRRLNQNTVLKILRSKTKTSIHDY